MTGESEVPPSGELPKAELHALMGRNDRAASIHVLVSLIVFVAGGVAAAELGSAGSSLWIVAAILCGGALTTFFPALHECGHRTAFRAPWLNDVVTAVCAFLMLQAPSFFREFHWEHHRSTQDREKDPEIAGAPALLDGWATNPIVYLGLACGQMLMVGKAFFTISSALMPSASAWEHALPFIRADRRSRVAWESRLVLLLWAALLAGGVHYVDGFLYVLSAWPIAHLFLGLYLMAEHTGLPNTGTQIERTRTVTSNAALRWLMWNMPLHTAHHAYPAVPFHQVPALHAQMRPALLHVSAGYLAFHREALARAFRLR